MSRSRDDGRHGGGHRETQGREYWSPRYRKHPMAAWGTLKREMHREERRRIRDEVLRLDPDDVSTDPCRNGTCEACRDWESEVA